jgi:Auxiliary Activity family 9 (formerly GH61)
MKMIADYQTIIALHEGDRLGGAQLYMACVQVKVIGSGGNVGDFRNVCLM